ncbi:MAG: DUF3783 domain-containing protein [Clostridia bacterium]|nr:DUF3783 domain-containing protein [Clostridia bacterium]
MNPNNPMLLTFDLQPKQVPALRVLCVRHGIQLIKADPAQYGETIGVLCGMDDAAGAAEAPALAEPMLLFANMPLAVVQKFLNEAKTAKFARPSLMAMLTETNRTWTPLQLQEQLMEERVMVREKMQSIHERSGHDHDHAHHHEEEGHES